MAAVPMLADLVANAGTKYDLCADIVKDMGCCFQSYRQYMLFGTIASVQALDEAQKMCTADGVKSLDKVCLCAYNKHTINGTTICSGTLEMLVDLFAGIVVCLTDKLFACIGGSRSALSIFILTATLATTVALLGL
jgi:hypothetical protein